MKTPYTPLEAALRSMVIYPQHTAVIDQDVHLSYHEFAQHTAQLMALLESLGVHAGDHVLLISPNSLHTLLAFHAVPLLGAVIVPLNPAFTDESLNFLALHADPKLALIDQEHLPRVAGTLGEIGIPVVPCGPASDLTAQLKQFPVRSLALPEKLDENSPISINYTSGTTSDPKGVMLTHRNVFTNSVNMIHHLNLHPGHVYLHALPLTHGNGWGAAWHVSAAGATHFLLRDPAEIRTALAEKVTHLCASPALIAPLADTTAAAPLPRKVRLMLAGTSPRPHMIRTLQRVGFEVLHGYGLIETSAVLTVTDLHEQDATPSSPDAQIIARQGHPMLYGGEIRVVGDDGQGVPHDGHTPGEIIIRSNQVMKGYYKNPKATRRAIKDGWLHTRDLAVIHPDGRMDILDREADLLKIAGQPFSSVQIETVLYRHPSVREAVVVANRDDVGDLPIAFVTLHPGAQVLGNEILGFCSPHLPEYALPRRVHIVPELPKTASGKVLKHVLREQIREKRATVNAG